MENDQTRQQSYVTDWLEHEISITWLAEVLRTIWEAWHVSSACPPQRCYDGVKKEFANAFSRSSQTQEVVWLKMAENLNNVITYE